MWRRIFCKLTHQLWPAEWPRPCTTLQLQILDITECPCGGAGGTRTAGLQAGPVGSLPAPSRHVSCIRRKGRAEVAFVGSMCARRQPTSRPIRCLLAGPRPARVTAIGSWAPAPPLCFMRRPLTACCCSRLRVDERVANKDVLRYLRFRHAPGRIR